LRSASGILISIGIILVVFGSRLRIVERYGSDLPWWDQWGGEAEQVLTPWLQHGELWRNLFTPYSEHRIAPTKALNLALEVMGGQWDARVQCVVNAMLVAALAAVLLGWVRGGFAPFWSLAATILGVLFLSLPLASDNILGGFQSQFLFLAGFSLAAIYGLINRPAGSALWLLASCAGCLALVSMGSGFFFSIPVLCVTAFRLAGAGRRLGLWTTLAAAILFSAIGWWIRPLAPWQGVLHAKNAHDYFLYLAHCLAWPKPDWPWLGLPFWLPWGVLAARWTFSSSRRDEPARTFVFAGGFWVLLQLLAVSYARGARGEYPANRYAEILTLGLLFSFLSLPFVFPASWRRTPIVIGILWSLAVAGIASYQSRRFFEFSLPASKASYAACERNIQGYLITNEFSYLNKTPVTEIPLFAGEPLARVMAPPEIRGIMPASVRPPIPLEPGGKSAGFHLGGTSPETPPLALRRVWGSFASAAGGAAAEWKSSIIPASPFAYWKIEVSGSLGSPGTSLDVVSEESGKVLSGAFPTRIAGNSWRAAYARAPREPARLVAHADSPSTWFAFSAPVEMSGLSYWSLQLARKGSWLLLGGLPLGAAGMVGWLLSNRRTTPAPKP